MPDCSEIKHEAGYDPATGQWIEQYYYERSDGQVFVYLQNHPPEGQRSRTPPAQVGLENGFCTIQESAPAELAIEEISTTQGTVSSPPRDDFLGGAGVWILLAIGGAIAAGCVVSNAKEKSAQRRYDTHAINTTPKPFTPTDQPVAKTPTEDDLIMLKLLHQTPVAVAVQEIWGANPRSSDYERYKTLYLNVRSSYESQYPNAKFEDSTV